MLMRENAMATTKSRKPRASAPVAPVRTNTLGDRLLDARRDRLDLRDRQYQPPLASLPDQFPDNDALKTYLGAYAKADLILDQGREGACTGFGLACVINYLMWIKAGCPREFKKASARMLYHLARMYDEWPGEDYDGSSCRGALKGWHKHGVCSEGHWPYRNEKGIVAFVPPSGNWAEDAVSRTLGVYYRIDKNSVVDIQAAINEIGAVYVSSDVHKGWFLDRVEAAMSFDKLPVIRRPKNAKADGGHAFALVGYSKTGFIIQNSWGAHWGLGGFAILPYEDWVDFGFDAWAAALGVARDAKREITPAKPASKVFLRHDARAEVKRAVGVTVGRAAGAEKRLSQEDAYRRTLVFGNDGFVERRIVEHENADATVHELGCAIPAKWFGARRGDGRDRLVVYAHGGLNSESASLARIRALGSCFEANGVYPLFLTWKTGVKETIANLIEDKLADLVRPAGGPREWLESIKDSVIEAKDRALEAAARQILVRAIWEQMKQNAAAAALTGRGGQKLAEALGELAAQRGDKLEIHLVGHSAGAIILGHLLAQMPGQVASCTLYAPACTVDFANKHYAASVEGGKLNGRKFRIHVLSDERECEDGVGPYGKSLLYMVSRALEPVHKTPILGLARCFDPRFNNTQQWNAEHDVLRQEATAALKAWQGFWKDRPLAIESRASVSMGSDPAAGTTPAVHGCFDNHAEVVDSTMALILGRKPELPAENLNY
jgi:pimeloyl-ACP methyl ester carboxylesterase